MKIYLQKIIFINRAPFDKLELDFNENEIVVLTAVNGSGKTTLLSHLVDAWYEMAKPHFPYEFEEKENKFYRVSSPIYNLIQNQPSFVYFRFRTPEGSIDYIDIRNKCTLEEYNEAIKIEGKISFNEIQPNLEQNNMVKMASPNFTKQTAEKVFFNNLITYFPSYRFETPGYLNEPYKVNLDFKKLTGYSGYLKNPIEVITGLPQLANWIMDIVLDMRMSPNLPDLVLYSNLNNIITQTLVSKKQGALGFGIGLRGMGSTRIQIVNSQTRAQVYPTIFNLSSGESSILCLFGEILRQADNNKYNIQLADITGIVLIDEVDKHLHIKLQKEVLPKLFKLFPNVQFILSSHSPFLSMGLAEEIKERSKIIDLDNLGISTDPTTNELYSEVYNMMIGENERFKELYQLLEQKIKDGTVPLIITEGKTDIQHIKNAKEKLNVENCELDFYEITEDWGDSKLKLLLEQLSKIKQTRKVIGIFDRDVKKVIDDIEKDGNTFKNYSNNVYAFCIPSPNGRENYTNVSIEFYYSDAELKKQKDGKCLYFNNELNFDSKRIPISPITSPVDNLEKKIWCENIGNLNWIHSKANFAQLIETDSDFINDFDFSKFNLIFDRIKLIINPVELTPLSRIATQ